MIPKLYSGLGALTKLEYILNKNSPNKILLVTGKKSFKSSGAAQIVNLLLCKIPTERFCEFSVNPSVNDVNSGIALLKKNKADLILAIGGGSVIDMAKLISILPYQKQSTISTIKSNKITEKGIPLVAIPTTSGSGSEMTHFAVVYIEGVKYSLAHSQILPDYAIVDPSLTFSMPVKQKAISGMDALCQAIESYWALSATNESRNYAEKAIKIILRNLEPSVCDNDRDAITQMAYGSNLSGRAINISKTTAAHAISYALTSFHGIPHGHAVSMLIPALIMENDNALRSSGNTTIMEQLYQFFDTSDADACVDRFIKLRQNIGLNGLESLTFSDKDITKILANVNMERLSNNPAAISPDKVKQIFKNKK